MNEAPLLSVRNLRVVYPGDDGDVVAVRNVSFTVARERLGIVGESAGCAASGSP
jgi:peptide/nickel transport system ATP-binding protein